MKNEKYYIYYGYRSSYIKSVSGKAIAISELIDPILPWKKSYYEVIFSTEKKFTIHLPAFSTAGNISLNGNHFIKINGGSDGKGFYYTTVFENHSIQFRELVSAENYELYVDGQQVDYIHYFPLLTKELHHQRIGTELVAPEFISTIVILFALWQNDNYGPMT